MGLSTTGSSCASTQEDDSSCAESADFSWHVGVSPPYSRLYMYLVGAMSASLPVERRRICRFLRNQQMTSAPASMPEPNTAPKAMPAIAPASRPTEAWPTGAGVVETVALLIDVSFVAPASGGVIFGGAVLTLGFSAQSPPTLTSRVSVVAFACQMVQVSASKSTMTYAAEKKGLPIIETSLTLSLDVGVKAIPGEEESVWKAPSDATYSRGRMRMSFDRVNLEVPSRIRDKSPP
jgi:hypothetical protein